MEHPIPKATAPLLTPEEASQRTHVQLGEAMSLISRIYLKLTGCSLSEYGTMEELSNEIMQILEDRDLEERELASRTVDEEDD